ncbi:MAG: hypothetical protein Phyf2KO_11580 [Phycisphaerales bacterium]
MKQVTLGIALLLCCVQITSQSARADELLVPSQYASIQLAIDNAADGDEIVVSPGTYREFLDTLGKRVHIRSLDPDDPMVVSQTVLSADIDSDGVGESSVVWAVSGETTDTIVEGFTVTQGRFPAGSAFFVFESGLTIRNCRIHQNESTGDTLGGAIACLDGTLAVQDCTFAQNIVHLRGSDIYMTDSDVELLACDFSGANSFGGEQSISIYSTSPAGSLTIRECLFADTDGAIDFRGSYFEIVDTELRNVSVTSITVNADEIVMAGCVVTQCGPELNTRGDKDSVIEFIGSSIQVMGTDFVDNINDTQGGQTGALLVAGSTALITDCTFSGNTMSQSSSFGGGLVAAPSSLTLEHSVFIDNYARYGGAAELFSGDMLVQDCYFYDNSADQNGALFVNRCDAYILNCTYEHNEATGETLDGNGGAVGAEAADSLVIQGSKFVGNVAAGLGGGVFVDTIRGRGEALVDGCFFGGNAAGAGGAVFFSGSRPLQGITNSVLVECDAGGAGGAICSVTDVDIVGNTFVYNTAMQAADLYHAGDTVQFQNNAILGSGSQPRVVIEDNDTVTKSIVEHSIIPGGYTGPGTVNSVYDAQVEFVLIPTGGADGWGDDPSTPAIDESANDEYGNITLAADSLGIDAGNNDAVLADAFDLDGDGDTDEVYDFDYFALSRFVDDPSVSDTGQGSAPIVDIGAAERQQTACVADVNGDGVLTPSDFTAWIQAFNNALPTCDQNNDGVCTPADFTSWIANYNLGC